MVLLFHVQVSGIYPEEVGHLGFYFLPNLSPPNFKAVIPFCVCYLW